MATISSAIEIQDRFSRALNRFENGLINVTSRFETLQNVMKLMLLVQLLIIWLQV